MTRYQHHEIDIRDREKLGGIVAQITPDAVVHAAAQPSHDLAASIPFADLEINAVGTLNLLEACRKACPEAPFVYLSTNKVYGDGPNRIPLKELETRWDYDDPNYADGIDESFPIDQCTHSLFGVSKTAADLMVQEHGRYFGMPTVCLRGGCLTGPRHSGVELHGFLSFLVKSNLTRRPYQIFGYKGKQVRDNIHAYDIARLIEEIEKSPCVGEVFNVGGGRENSCSIFEAFEIVHELSGNRQEYTILDENRLGDHICYLSNLSKIRQRYPDWSITVSLRECLRQMVEAGTV